MKKSVVTWSALACAATIGLVMGLLRGCGVGTGEAEATASTPRVVGLNSLRSSEETEQDPATDRLVQLAKGLEALEAAASRATSPSDVTQAEFEDKEWEAIKRKRASIFGGFCVAPQSITVEHLIRNVHLNPEDAWVAPSKREILRQLIDSYRGQIDGLSQVHGEALVEKLRDLQASGLLIQVDEAIANLPASASHDAKLISERKRLDPAFGDVDGALIMRGALRRLALANAGAVGTLMIDGADH